MKLFDIQIRDNGLIVRPKDNSLMQTLRLIMAMQALTNLTSMPYGTLLSKRQFLSEFGWIRVAGKQGRFSLTLVCYGRRLMVRQPATSQLQKTKGRHC